MNAPATITHPAKAGEEAPHGPALSGGGELFAGHNPSRFDWQIWLYNPGRESKGLIFQYPKSHSERAVLRRANQDAIYSMRRRFAVRDCDGRIVHDGPTLDALGGPAPESWFVPLGRELAA